MSVLATPKPYKLPKPKKGRNGHPPPKVHKNATKAMEAVAYGLTLDGDGSRQKILNSKRKADENFSYYVTPELCAFIICRWNLLDSEAKEHGSNKVTRSQTSESPSSDDSAGAEPDVLAHEQRGKHYMCAFFPVDHDVDGGNLSST